MTKIIFNSLLGVFFVLGTVLSILFFTNSYILLGSLTVFILVISTIIFTHPKAYPFRFMYPGLLTFLFFMILPMMFTIYIGFTNLSTGHFLTKEAAFSALSKDTYIPENAKSYIYKLRKVNTHFEILATGEEDSKEIYTGQFVLSDKAVILDVAPESLGPFDEVEGMSLGGIFKLRKHLKNLVFVLPDGQKVKYHRTNYLSSLENKYLVTKNGEGLIDRESGKMYLPNNKTGYYSDGQEDLVPGFYVNVGFKNFLSLFTDESIKSSFFQIFAWTMVWAGMSVFLSFTMGLFLALVVNNKNLKNKVVFRILLIIPYSIPFFISVLVFRGLMNKDFGIINELVSYLGFAKVPWLTDPFWAKVSCLLVNLWLGFPYMFLVTTGLLQAIPESIYEAAALDGAGRFVKLRKITFPLIFSAIGPLLVGSFAFALNNFVGIYLLTGGGPPIQGAVTPAGETDILISYTYRLAFEGGQGQDFGLASAISMLIFVIIAILTAVNFKLSGMMKEQQRA